MACPLQRGYTVDGNQNRHVHLLCWYGAERSYQVSVLIMVNCFTRSIRLACYIGIVKISADLELALWDWFKKSLKRPFITLYVSTALLKHCLNAMFAHTVLNTIMSSIPKP